MGEGMSNFIKREVVTLKDQTSIATTSPVWWASALICGRVRYWRTSARQMEDLSNSMGLFLQKTNIIRDYLEDIEEPAPRMFWPKCVWSKHAGTGSFRHPENRDSAVSCMNISSPSFCSTAWTREYMSKLKNVDVFRFCAIPQVMAIATGGCTTRKVFEGVVKTRRGLSARSCSTVWTSSTSP